MANFYGSYIGFGADGTGGVAGFSFPGTTYAYLHGGGTPSAITNIEKFDMSSDGSASSVGDLSIAQLYVGHSNRSAVNGYSQGGSADSDRIDKWVFANDGTASNIGNLSVGRGSMAGASSGDYCYNCSGSTWPATPDTTNVIDKFSVVSDGDATDVGNATISVRERSGSSSATYGYAAGGYPFINVIDKYSFAAGTQDATDIGNLITGRTGRVGSSSATYGFKAAGETATDLIDKWAFASDGDATDVGNLTASQYGSGGSASSVTYGYVMSGDPTLDRTEKWSHSSDGDASSVSDPATPRNQAGGTHV